MSFSMEFRPTLVMSVLPPPLFATTLLRGLCIDDRTSTAASSSIMGAESYGLKLTCPGTGPAPWSSARTSGQRQPLRQVWYGSREGYAEGSRAKGAAEHHMQVVSITLRSKEHAGNSQYRTSGRDLLGSGAATLTFDAPRTDSGPVGFIQFEVRC